MEITTITNARKNLYNLAEQAIESHEPVTLTTKKGNVVMISAEEYEVLKETLYILETNPSIASEVKDLKSKKIEGYCERKDLEW